MLCNIMGVGGVYQISRKKYYKVVRFNVISITMGWTGITSLAKKRYEHESSLSFHKYRHRLVYSLARLDRGT